MTKEKTYSSLESPGEAPREESKSKDDSLVFGIINALRERLAVMRESLSIERAFTHAAVKRRRGNGRNPSMVGTIHGLWVRDPEEYLRKGKTFLEREGTSEDNMVRFANLRERAEFLITFFSNIEQWLKEIEQERNYNGRLFAESQKETRKNHWHNPRLWRTPDGNIYEKYETATEVMYVPMGEDPIVAALRRDRITSLPEGSICAGEALEEDFGWCPLDGRHLYDQEELSMRKGLLLRCIAESAQQLLQKKTEVAQWLVQEGQRDIYFSENRWLQAFWLLQRITDVPEKNYLEGIKSLFENQGMDDQHLLDIQCPQLKFLREILAPLVNAVYQNLFVQHELAGLGKEDQADAE